MKGIILVLFIVFLSCYIGKLMIIQSKYRVKAYVLGKQKKDIELVVKIGTLLWGITWFYYGLLGDKGFNSVALIGISMLSIGLLIFIIAMVTMGKSWRVGVDEKSQTDLVNQGLFKISRNPTFVGFDLMFIGLAVILPNIWVVTIALVNIVGLHLLILKEEKHLEAMLGQQYIDYKSRIPRYLFIK